MKSAFEEVLKRFDAKWEAKFAGSESVKQERAAETDRRLTALEQTSAAVATTAAHVSALEQTSAAVAATTARVSALEQSSTAVASTPACVSALEAFCSAQSEAMAVANDWGRSMDLRVGELEQRADDLELIRITEICDERDARVEALKGAQQVFDEWRPWVEASIHDLRLEVKRLAKPVPQPTTQTSAANPGVVSFVESDSAHPSAGATSDWPYGHREKGYGSVTTLTHTPFHGTSSLPPPPVFPD